MTKTSLDITTEALRMIGVSAVDESPESADQQRAKAHLDAIYADLDDSQGAAFEWTVETVPDRLFLHLSMAVAGSICTAYGFPQFVGLYQRGMMKIRADEFGAQPQADNTGVFY